jgi:predicted alpha/beta hydrolase family esterase
MLQTDIVRKVSQSVFEAVGISSQNDQKVNVGISLRVASCLGAEEHDAEQPAAADLMQLSKVIS